MANKTSVEILVTETDSGAIGAEILEYSDGSNLPLEENLAIKYMQTAIDFFENYRKGCLIRNEKPPKRQRIKLGAES